MIPVAQEECGFLYTARRRNLISGGKSHAARILALAACIMLAEMILASFVVVDSFDNHTAGRVSHHSFDDLNSEKKNPSWRNTGGFLSASRDSSFDF